MSDIERLCDRVLVVDHGRLVYDGTLPELARRVGAAAGARGRPVGAASPPLSRRRRPGSAAKVRVSASGSRSRPSETTAARVLAEVSAQAEVRDLTLEEPAIEDIVRTLYHSTPPS